MKKKSAQIFTEIPIKGPQCICLSVKLIDSIFRTGENYHPQEFLGECKYVIKEKKMPNYITDNIEVSSNEEHSDEENSDKKNCDEKNYSKE